MSQLSSEQWSDEALVSRVSMIEQQPLAERASSFAQLHDELQHELEKDDSSDEPREEHTGRSPRVSDEPH